LRVRRAAVRHPNLPETVLQKAFEDKDSEIRRIAAGKSRRVAR
jgi:hypothetical protein